MPYSINIIKNDSNSSIEELINTIREYDKTDLLLEISETNYNYADPFIIDYNNEIYIFFEKQDIKTNRGVIAFTKIKKFKNRIIFTEPETVLDNGRHVSFPYLFIENNEIFMLPEENKLKKLVLYKSYNFPYDWKPYNIISNNLRAKDPVIFKLNNIYYIITLVRIYRKIYQEQIYYTKNLDDVFQKHPYNNKSIRKPYNNGSGRGAGYIFVKNDILYKPEQYSINFYGEGLILCKIELDINNYNKIYMKNLIVNTHHLSFNNNFIVFDKLV
jgi:hypothetical protein